MSTEAKVPDTEDILRSVMDRWKAGIDAHDPQKVADVFTADAIFQGLQPYSVGRQGVADYYEGQPVGMTVTYRILESRRLADDLALGYLRADFSRPDGSQINLYIGVLALRNDDGWRIGHYQASAGITSRSNSSIPDRS
jgi:uncharacterized protein (TIGR02246 family)